MSPSRFPDENFDEFAKAEAYARKGRQVTTSVIPPIEGKIKDHKCVSGGIPFNNLDQLLRSTLVTLANGTLADMSLDNNALVSNNPDLYYGARPEQLDPHVRTELSDHIIPSTQLDFPIAPNFFLAAKGPRGTIEVAGYRACYDSAIGARGMHSLRSYGQDYTAYDNKAYTISSIYYGGTLQMYTSHPGIGLGGGETEYYMTKLKAWAMTSDSDTFRRGLTAFPNARDWAKEIRDGFITNANERRRRRNDNSKSEGASIINDAPGPKLASTTFISAASHDELYTIDSSRSREEFPRISVKNDPNNPPTHHIQELSNSTNEMELDFKLPAKKSAPPKRSNGLSEPLLKRQKPSH